jgi:uncharacterized membrane protein
MLPHLLADPSPYLAVFGRFHPVLLHAPLGILPALALLEFGAAVLRRPVPRGAILALAWLCAVTAAAAAASGFVLAGEGDYGGDTTSQHKILGITLGGICLLAALFAFLQNRNWFRIMLLAACGVMIPTGHLGGNITHGEDFLFEPLRAKKPSPAAPADGKGGVPAPDASEFVSTIQPILEHSCKGCHNPDKQKGELILTTIEGIEKGGENGAVIVPGKPDDSPLVTHCELPLDDDDHMPPPKKPQPTAEEVRALRTWVQNGAKFD